MHAENQEEMRKNFKAFLLLRIFEPTYVLLQLGLGSLDTVTQN